MFTFVLKSIKRDFFTSYLIIVQINSFRRKNFVKVLSIETESKRMKREFFLSNLDAQANKRRICFCQKPSRTINRFSQKGKRAAEGSLIKASMLLDELIRSFD